MPSGWRQRRVEDWLLYTHPNLPIVEVRSPHQGQLGLLMGWAIGLDGALTHRQGHILYDGPSNDTSRFEDWLYTLGGRFACVCGRELGGTPRLYLDSCGTLAAVYRNDRPEVASTQTLLNWNDWQSYARRKAAEPVLNPNQLWPAGLTSDPDISRLLPNHYLDLQSWRAVRHWPVESLGRARGDTEGVAQAVDEVARQISRTIRAVAAQYPLYLGLTAGRDSRMMLACSRSVLERAEFVTFVYTDAERKADAHISRPLARKLGLRHLLLPLVQPNQSQKESYLLQVGYVGHWGKARDFDIACRRFLSMDHAWLTGFGGEVGRAFYWSAGDHPERWPSAADLLARLKAPDDPRVADTSCQWLAGMPECGTFEFLDRLYIEQRMGCWAGPHMYGAAPFAASLSPFCQRKMIELVISLPTTFRRNEALVDAIAERLWPELQKLPYQQLTGLRGLADRTSRGMRRRVRTLAHRVRRAARKALGT